MYSAWRTIISGNYWWSITKALIYDYGETINRDGEGCVMHRNMGLVQVMKMIRIAGFVVRAGFGEERLEEREVRLDTEY